MVSWPQQKCRKPGVPALWLLPGMAEGEEGWATALGDALAADMVVMYRTHVIMKECESGDKCHEWIVNNFVATKTALRLSPHKVPDRVRTQGQ